MTRMLMRALLHRLYPDKHRLLELLHQDGTVTRTCSQCGQYWRQEA